MTRVKEKRRHPRIPLENRVTYILFNEKRRKVRHGIGHTQNLSQTGVLLKTKKILEGAFVVLLTMDLERKQIKIMGKIVVSRYCNDSGVFLTGVQFIGQKDEQAENSRSHCLVHEENRFGLSLRRRRIHRDTAGNRLLIGHACSATDAAGRNCLACSLRCPKGQTTVSSN